MRIAVTNHHRKLVGGTETYLNAVIPGFEQAGHQIMLFHEAEVLPGEPAIAASRHSADWVELASFHPNLVFNHGLQSPAREYALSEIAPVVHFAHNYHGTCISGEKTRKLPVAAACCRRFGPACLAQYLPRSCGGWNPLVMLTDYRTQAGRLQAIGRARAVVTASRYMADEYRRNDIRNLHVAPLFVTPAPLAPPQDSASFRILFAGRITRVKGARLLAEAIHLVRRIISRPVQVTFAGEGPDRAQVEKLCPDADFPGWVSRAELAGLAASHHVLAMPSIWPEPFGLAGLESGLPVAAFRVGGIPEWLTDGYNGALAAPGPPSAEAFASALVRCAAIPNAREHAHAAASRFTIERHLAILLPILEGACAS